MRNIYIHTIRVAIKICVALENLYIARPYICGIKPLRFSINENQKRISI